MTPATAQLVLLLTVIHDPSDRTIAQAAAGALAAAFVEPPGLVIREVGEAPGENRLGELLRNSGAQAAVSIACERAGCTRVTVQVVRRDGRSFTRVLRFDSRDRMEERGRTVGLLASTLLPDDWNRRGPGAGAAGEVPPVAPPVSPDDCRWTGEVGLTLFVPTAGVRGDVALLGAVRRRFGTGWEAGALARFERGGLETEPGDFFGAGAGLAGAWSSAGWAVPGRFGYGARLDLLAIRRHLRHEEPDEVETHDYWALGAQLSAVGGYALSPATTLLAAVGIETLPHIIANAEHGNAAERLSQYRLSFGLGISTRF